MRATDWAVWLYTSEVYAHPVGVGWVPGIVKISPDDSVVAFVDTTNLLVKLFQFHESSDRYGMFQTLPFSGTLDVTYNHTSNLVLYLDQEGMDQGLVVQDTYWNTGTSLCTITPGDIVVVRSVGSYIDSGQVFQYFIETNTY